MTKEEAVKRLQVIEQRRRRTMKTVGKLLMLTGWIWIVGIIGHDDLLTAQNAAATAGNMINQILTPLAILGTGWILER